MEFIIVDRNMLDSGLDAEQSKFGLHAIGVSQRAERSGLQDIAPGLLDGTGGAVRFSIGFDFGDDNFELRQELVEIESGFSRGGLIDDGRRWARGGGRGANALGNARCLNRGPADIYGQGNDQSQAESERHPHPTGRLFFLLALSRRHVAIFTYLPGPIRLIA